jgi:SPP1 gp7 family putative phage head morphogenesis protein
VASISKKPETIAQESEQAAFRGATGTSIFGGYFNEETLAALQGRQAYTVYDEMRRSDAQIRMILSALKNPIKSAKFYHEPTDESEEAHAVAKALDWVWFGGGCVRFSQFLTECLTMFDFGHAVFERAFAVAEHPELGAIHVPRIGFRKQQTVERWIVDGQKGLTAIEQYAYGDTVDKQSAQMVRIPVEDLVILTLEREGDNYEGVSLLRSCYGAWARKNFLLKLMAIGTERSALSTPVGKFKYGTKSEDIDDFEDSLQSFVLHEQAYICMPDVYQIEVIKHQFDSDKVKDALVYEDGQIAKSALLQFMELGQNGNGGSYSLGTDQSDFLLSALTFVGEIICEAMHEVNKELVEMNFGPGVAVPVAKADGINSKAGKEMADVLKTLVDSRIIKNDAKLEAFTRNLYALPDRDENEVSEAPEPTPAPAQKEDAPKFSETTGKCGHAHGKVIKLADSKTWRPLTVYEQPLNFAEIKAEFQSEGETLESSMRSQLTTIADKTVRRIKTVLEKRSPGKITRAETVSGVQVEAGQYRATLRKALGAIVGAGTKQAARDFGLKLKKKVELAETFTKNTEYLPDHVKSALIAQSDAQVEAHANEIRKRIMAAVAAAEDGNLTDIQLITRINVLLGEYIGSASVGHAARILTSQMMSRGRNEFFFDKKNLKQIQAFQYSAVVDDATTDICLSLDGKTFTPGEQDDSLRPPNHFGCRSILIPITINEEPPEITGLDVDPTNPNLITQYESRGEEPPTLQEIKESRNL